MFGTNAIAKARTSEEGFLVHSIFYTLQGEGPFAGQPALFVRLAGCNLQCTFCDTDFAKGDYFSADALAAEISRRCQERIKCELVVITGGEPLLQPIGDLIFHESLDWLSFQIETAGHAWHPSMDVPNLLRNAALTIVCSPKLAGLHPQILKHAQCYKYILRASDPLTAYGLPKWTAQAGGTPKQLWQASELPMHTLTSAEMPDDFPIIYVQACDEQDPVKNAANLQAAARSALAFGYTLSVQIHKLVGLD